MNAGKADGERISHLERALSQAKSETQELAKKLKEAEDSHVNFVKQIFFLQLKSTIPAEQAIIQNSCIKFGISLVNSYI